MKLSKALSQAIHYPAGLVLGAASVAGLCQVVSLDQPLVPKQRRADLAANGIVGTTVKSPPNLYANLRIMSGANLMLDVSETSLAGIRHSQAALGLARSVAGSTLALTGKALSLAGKAVSTVGTALEAPGANKVAEIKAHPVTPGVDID